MAENLAVHELTQPYRCGHCQTGNCQRCHIVYRDAGLKVTKVKGQREPVTERVDVTCACAAANPDAHRKEATALAA